MQSNPGNEQTATINKEKSPILIASQPENTETFYRRINALSNYNKGAKAKAEKLKIENLNTGKEKADEALSNADLYKQEDFLKLKIPPALHDIIQSSCDSLKNMQSGNMLFELPIENTPRSKLLNDYYVAIRNAEANGAFKQQPDLSLKPSQQNATDEKTSNISDPHKEAREGYLNAKKNIETLLMLLIDKDNHPLNTEEMENQIAIIDFIQRMEGSLVEKLSKKNPIEFQALIKNIQGFSDSSTLQDLDQFINKYESKLNELQERKEDFYITVENLLNDAMTIEEYLPLQDPIGDKKTREVKDKSVALLKLVQNAIDVLGSENLEKRKALQKEYDNFETALKIPEGSNARSEIAKFKVQKKQIFNFLKKNHLFFEAFKGDFKSLNISEKKYQTLANQEKEFRDVIKGRNKLQALKDGVKVAYQSWQKPGEAQFEAGKNIILEKLNTFENDPVVHKVRSHFKMFFQELIEKIKNIFKPADAQKAQTVTSEPDATQVKLLQPEAVQESSSTKTLTAEFLHKAKATLGALQKAANAENNIENEETQDNTHSSKPGAS